MLLYILALTAFLFLCIIANKLTWQAAIVSGLIGTLITVAAGLTGAAMLLTFFVLSVMATAHKKAFKLVNAAALEQDGARKAGQVFANGGTAAIVAVLCLIDGTNRAVYMIMMAGSLASALADTLSSELGMVYGKSHMHVLTFKKDQRGENGVISLEGTLIGTLGAVLIAIIYSRNLKDILVVLLAGITGNLADSILGATFERKGLMSNDAVNFLSTVVAALVGLALYIHA